jgi:thymidylate synthase (FAD)
MNEIEIIKPSFEILTPIDGDEILLSLERAARTCYKSEDKITTGSATKLVKRLICDLKHESVIEHVSLSVRFICDRGVTHEMVRHRIAAFSQESTRYVNYSKKGMQFILPPWVDDSFLGVWDTERWESLDVLSNDVCQDWLAAMQCAADYYSIALEKGWKPQHARSVLPNSLKTEIVMSANLREWRHVFNLRTSQAAHPQIREVMIPLLLELQSKIPVIFDNIEPYISKAESQ